MDLIELDASSFKNTKECRPASNFVRMKATKGGRPRMVDAYCFRTNMTKNWEEDIVTYKRHPILLGPIPSKPIDHILKMAEKSHNSCHLAYMRRAKLNKVSYKDASVAKRLV